MQIRVFLSIKKQKTKPKRKISTDLAARRLLMVFFNFGTHNTPQKTLTPVVFDNSKNLSYTDHKPNWKTDYSPSMISTEVSSTVGK